MPACLVCADLLSSHQPAHSHDQCRRNRPRPLGKKYRRCGSGQEQASAVHPRREQRPRTGQRFRGGRGFEVSTEFEDAVADPRVQAVFLATPHSLHVGQISAVAAARKPVWCEKPLALTRAEAARAIEATTKAGVPFALGNNKRCFPCMLEMKRIVADGTLGEILHIEGNFSNEHSTRVKGGWRDDPRESPGGGMTGAGLHVLDAFVNIAGPLAKVNACVYSQKPPPDPRDAAVAMVQFDSGATGVLATVRAAPMFW